MPLDTLPTFFFSYARRDADATVSPVLKKFFEDLQDTLEKRTPGLPEGSHLGTHDRRVGQGRDWDSDLSRGLRSNKALVAVATPAYFSRENCGKEIAVFARRDEKVRLDEDGSLRDATNILHIRWYEDAAYEHNRVKDAVVHPVLRKITWTPAETGQPDRAKAIKRYRDKGMERCVKPGREYYKELLGVFAQSIKDMPELPEAPFNVAWNDIVSAFSLGWSQVPPLPTVHFAAATPVPAQASVAPPSGPADVIVFYLTRRLLFIDTRIVSFADRMVDEPGWRCSAPPISQEPYLGVVQAVQQACLQERLNDFHCASAPQIPVTSDVLIDRLAALSEKNVIVALAVDPALWLGSAAPDGAARTVIDEVAKSTRWHGPVLLPVVDDQDTGLNFPALLQGKDLSRVVAVLPRGKEQMVDSLRSQLIRERGRITRASRDPVTDEDQRPPVLQGPGSSPQ